MITRIIIFSLILVLCILLVVVGIVNDQPGAIVFGIIWGIFATIFLVWVVDAFKCGNVETVRYEFPAENYKIERRVMVSFRDTLIDGSQYQVVDTSSVYVLTGVEPIFETKESKKFKIKTRTVLDE